MKKRIIDKDFIVPAGTLLLIQAFMYWGIKFFQSDFHVISFALDTKIPFIPQFIFIYNLFYPFLFIAYFVIYKYDTDLFHKALYSSSLGLLICYTIYLLYPVVMVRPNLNDFVIDKATYFVINVTYSLDSPAINTFPSIHALLCAEIIYPLFKVNLSRYKKTILIVISTLIIISTLFVKQHYFYDIILSLVICLISISIPRIKKDKS